MFDPAKRLVITDDQPGGVTDRVDLAGIIAGCIRRTARSLSGVIEKLVDVARLAGSSDLVECLTVFVHDSLHRDRMHPTRHWTYGRGFALRNGKKLGA
jgi:hypothetical protein